MWKLPRNQHRQHRASFETFIETENFCYAPQFLLLASCYKTVDTRTSFTLCYEFEVGNFEKVRNGVVVGQFTSDSATLVINLNGIRNSDYKIRPLSLESLQHKWECKMDHMNQLKAAVSSFSRPVMHLKKIAVILKGSRGRPTLLNSQT